MPQGTPHGIEGGAAVGWWAERHSDVIVAAPRAAFALPEASRGLFANAGGLARLVRLVGLPVASEVAMAGRVLGAHEALALQIVNKVSRSNESVVEEAVALADKIAGLSPDAIIATRFGLWGGLEEGSVETAAQRADQRYSRALVEGDNIRIGLEAFAKKQKPRWVASKL